MNHSTIVAENHITVTRPLFDEGMRAIENPSYRKTLAGTAAVIAALTLGIGAYLYHIGASPILILGECIVMIAALVWLTIIHPKNKKNHKYNAMCPDADTQPERTTRFYHSQFCVTTNAGKEITVPYTDIVIWQETEHLWILRCANNMNLLLDKKGFVTGDFEQIKALLSDE